MRKVVKLPSNRKGSSGDMQCGYGGRERYIVRGWKGAHDGFGTLERVLKILLPPV